MKLYELTEALAKIEAEIENAETPDLAGLASKLNQYAVQFEYKAEQIARMIVNYKADIQALKTEEDRLAAKRKALTSRTTYLEGYLMCNMLDLGLNNVKSGTFKIVIQDNPYSVTEANINALPDEFIRTIPETKEADKKAIMDHFKATGEIPYGAVIAKTQRLVIK